MTGTFLIIDRPGAFRDALAGMATARGMQVQVQDDAMDTLGALEAIGVSAPSVVLVSEDPGPPGAGSLCRILRRKLGPASVVRLGDPAQHDVFDTESSRLPRTLGVDAIARTLFAGEPAPHGPTSSRVFELALGAQDLPPLLVAIAERWLSGQLVLGFADAEREIHFLRGMPVFSRSSRFSERLGAVAVRRGLVSGADVELALDVARSHQQRLGEVLVSRASLTGSTLFAALGAQLLEQLVAACSDGPCRARFVPDAGVVASGPVLRMQAMTAVFVACEHLPADDLERALAAGEGTALPPGPLPTCVQRFLGDLGVPDIEALLTPARLGADLRPRLRESLAHAAGLEPRVADAVLLALLQALRPLEVPTPSVPAPARNEHERVVDSYLHGRRGPELAAQLALRGPAPEAHETHAELLAAYARATSGDPRALLPTAGHESAPAVRSAALELRKHTEALAAQLGDTLAQHAGLAIREQVERALLHWPDLEPAQESVHVTKLSIPPAPPIAARAGVSKAPPTPPPAARGSLAPPRPRDPALAVLTELEALVEHGKWVELKTLLAGRFPDPSQLPPSLGLLYAIALKEEAPGEVLDAKRIDADALGIRAVEQLLGVQEQSQAALVIAKRMLRRRPIEWNQKPPARISLLLVVVALLVGAGAGLFINPNLLLHLPWK